MALLPETFYLSTRRISVAYDVKKTCKNILFFYATQLMLVKILINSFFFFSFGFMLQDMSLTVALNNIQSVDRGEDEKVSFLKLNLS